MASARAQKSRGNLLGAGRAEADTEMLRRAFVEIPAYRALVETQDFNFVVGRRGTGKSALFEKIREEYSSRAKTLVISEKPAEYHALELQAILGRMGHEYRTLRPITRLLWKAHVLLEVVTNLRTGQSGFRFNKSSQFRYLSDTLINRKSLLKETRIARCIAMLKSFVAEAGHAVEVPGKLASALEIDRLQASVRTLLEETDTRVVILYDGLDEGWSPDPIATAVIGGPASAAGDFVDASTGIYAVLFVRDNIFRALAQLDSDFTRHVEGHILRLHCGMRLRSFIW